MSMTLFVSINIMRQMALNFNKADDVLLTVPRQSNTPVFPKALPSVDDYGSSKSNSDSSTSPAIFTLAIDERLSRSSEISDMRELDILLET